MSARALQVLVNGHVVGMLREENDLWQFEYTPDWRGDPAGFDLSPALPRDRQLHADGASSRPVQWYFARCGWPGRQGWTSPLSTCSTCRSRST